MMGQVERVLDYMQRNGGITAFEAFSDCGVTRLAARIFDLRQRGHVIANLKVKDKNRFGEDVTYDRYVLEDDAIPGTLIKG